MWLPSLACLCAVLTIAALLRVLLSAYSVFSCGVELLGLKHRARGRSPLLVFPIVWKPAGSGSTISHEFGAQTAVKHGHLSPKHGQTGVVKSALFFLFLRSQQIFKPYSIALVVFEKDRKLWRSLIKNMCPVDRAFFSLVGLRKGKKVAAAHY